MIAVLAGVVGLASCGREEAADHAQPVILPPVYEDDSFRAAPLDTVSYGLGPFIFGHRVADNDTVWAIDYMWFTLANRPGEVFTGYQMSKLEEAGEIDTTTAVGFVAYRVRIEAGNEEELLRETGRRRPLTTPPKLIQAVQGALPATEP